METKNTIAAVKKVYTSSADAVQRGFYAYLRRLQKDAAAAEADKQTQCAALLLKDAEEVQKKAAQHAKDMQRAAKKDAAKADAAIDAGSAAVAAADALAAARKNLQKVQKEAQKAKAESAADKIKAEAVAALADVMQRKNLRAEDFSKDFLLQYLPERFNAAQKICSRKEVQPEDAEEVRKQYASTPEALKEEDGKLYIMKEQNLFTANSLLSLFTKAADARSKQQKAEADKRSAEEKAADAAKKEAKKRARIEEYRRIVAEFDAAEAQK